LEEAPAASLDWRTKGVVNPVKSQGQCGSCWAFAAVAVLEGHYALRTNKLEQFSEQQIVSCDHEDDNEGCNGGLIITALQWISRGNYLATEAEYPYTAKDDQCNLDIKGHGGVTAVHLVTPKDITATVAAINKGPVGVLVSAGNKYFRFYQTGVMNAVECGGDLDHAITIVGYGTEDSEDYYIVRNSWGSGWGEEGYIRLGRVEGEGICRVQMTPSWVE
jgi:KDEL-tailed cysteine endopeptidase